MENMSGSPEKSCRDSWFMQKVVSELPVVGGFFKTADIKHGLHHAGKSSCMLVFGAAGMMLEPIPVFTENLEGSLAIKTTNMALGMYVGVVAYNVAESTASFFYKGARKAAETVHSACFNSESDEREKKQLLPT